MREVLIAVEINEILSSVAQSETSLTPAVTGVIFSFSDWLWDQYWFVSIFVNINIDFRVRQAEWIKINIQDPDIDLAQF